MTTARSVKIAPKGMGLNDFVAMKEGYFAAEGLDVEFDWKTFRGTQSSWKEFDYFQRPQDKPYTESKDDVIQGACVWGTICNASAGMGKVVADAYGDSPWAIFVRPDSKIREPKDLKDIPISVGMRAGSHFNVPYRLEKYLPLARKIASNYRDRGVHYEDLRCAADRSCGRSAGSQARHQWQHRGDGRVLKGWRGGRNDRLKTGIRRSWNR